jgi:hypothetical protein
MTMLDSLATAHTQGYEHGLVVGIVFGGLLVGAMVFCVVSLLYASAQEPPAPQAANLRPPLRVVRGGRR